ncbi:transglycosylase domain-containing protein [Glycomyces buryatensis]|uniref:transglycosylase domain-containing protein n=1 Tax=Glycomyces buryatensis TaxID=2570927 RepID=UPI0014562E59|nr:transglycosylase domain-containing protein [Glycomyces buryatensis]
MAGPEHDTPEPATSTTLRLRARVRAAIGTAKVAVTESREGRAVKRKRLRRKRIRRRFVALGVVLALLAGTAVVIASVFYAQVDLPDDLDSALSQQSTVYYSDGVTEMATLGAQARTSITLEAIPDHLQWALLAAEDANFYGHPGVDTKGVLRALVTNLTSDSTQGASTLTQQYVGQVADIRGDGSYLRKAREAAMAMKLEERYTKDEILTHYLNLVYFGRGAYGVEAAADAFFGVGASELDVAQSALLVAQIKSPDGAYDPRDPLGIGGTTEALTDRWNYVLDEMVAIDRLEPAERAELTELPETVDPAQAETGATEPTGFISHGRVLRELGDAGISTDEVLRGGLSITTTIDAELQDLVLDGTEIRTVADEDEHLAAATAAVEPGTGRVLAYYGGENGAGLDGAGAVGHRPGTSFNIVTATAAATAGISTWEETFDGSSPQTFETYTDEDGKPIELTNTGGASDSSITLGDAVSQKLDTPIYAVSEMIGGYEVARTAAALGVDQVWDPHDVDEDGVMARLPLSEPGHEYAPDLGIGAYPVTVLDQATVYATLAAGGIRAEPYFVERVEGPDGEVYRAEQQVERTVDEFLAMDAAVSMYDWEPETEAESAREFLPTNASPTWYAGYDPALSVAVWAGDERKEGDGTSPEGTLAESIWWDLMNSRPDRYKAWIAEEEAMRETEGDFPGEGDPSLDPAEDEPAELDEAEAESEADDVPTD